MKDTNDTPQSNEPKGGLPEEESGGPTKKPRRRLFFGLFAGLVGAVLVVPLAVASSGWGRCKPKSPEEAKERAGFFAEKVLDRVDATDEQREEVDALLDEIVPEVFAMKLEGRALKQRIHEALGAEQIDPVELEALRKEALVMADKASKKAVEGVLRASEILTPEQRAEIHEMIEEKRSRFQRWHERRGCEHHEH